MRRLRLKPAAHLNNQATILSGSVTRRMPNTDVVSHTHTHTRSWAAAQWWRCMLRNGLYIRSMTVNGLEEFRPTNEILRIFAVWFSAHRTGVLSQHWHVIVFKVKSIDTVASAGQWNFSWKLLKVENKAIGKLIKHQGLGFWYHGGLSSSSTDRESARF